ncbi:MAG: glycosyltransferase family 2 protein [Ruthenibacterium lactatiformans]
MRYDIVMVTYNSMKWLRACVAALAAVQYPLEELHLVFADNGSTDGTLRSCGAWQGNTRLSAALPWRKTARTLGSARHATAARQKGARRCCFF